MKVLDINDNTPVGAHQKISHPITAKSVPGEFILQVHSQDPDLGVGGEVSFSWDETANARSNFRRYLKLDDQKGVISLRRKPAPGPAKSFNFYVRLTDGGGLSSITQITVHLITSIDDIDQMPTFEKDELLLQVPENVKVGQEVRK